ncbi:MAG: protein BatD [Alphaproteobacteria bacterium]|nr:protein BatD [Alphaproteobacteria bacterium]
MKKFFKAFILAFMVTFSAQAGNFTAKVNRNHVPFGETFVLTLQYDDAPGTSEPDLTPLQKDFNIYSVGRDYQSTIINGQASQTYQWNVVLSPKVENVATIPAISFKNFSSSPIQITVAEAPEQKQNISMSFEISNSSPYLQEQIIYTLTIKTSENLQGSLPQFIDDGSQSWIIKQISEPIVNTELDNGIESKIITIQYALFPQKSGVLSIPQMRLHAYYPDKNKSRPVSSLFGAFFNEELLNSFGFNNNMNKVDLTTRSQTVEIRPIPEENNGYWWLPSQQVLLTSDWEKTLPTFKEGEPTNRRITLTAAGIIDTQLPKLSFKEVAGLKQYPEKPEISSYVTANGIVSQMTINVVYIPEKDGILDIPEINVPWYNINTGQMDRAGLPSLQISVENNPLLNIASNNITPKTNNSLSEVAQTSVEQQNISNSKIYALLALSFAFGLFFSWIFLRSKQDKTSRKAKTEPVLPKNIPSTSGKNAKEVRDIVINWARTNYPEANILNLDDVENLVADDKFTEILHQLKKDLYSGKRQGFNSQELEKLMRAHSAKKNKLSRKDQQILPNLYK